LDASLPKDLYTAPGLLFWRIYFAFCFVCADRGSGCGVACRVDPACNVVRPKRRRICLITISKNHASGVSGAYSWKIPAPDGIFAEHRDENVSSHVKTSSQCVQCSTKRGRFPCQATQAHSARVRPRGNCFAVAVHTPHVRLSRGLRTGQNCLDPARQTRERSRQWGMACHHRGAPREPSSRVPQLAIHSDVRQAGNRLQVLPAVAPDFEEAAVHACELVVVLQNANTRPAVPFAVTS